MDSVAARRGDQGTIRYDFDIRWYSFNYCSTVRRGRGFKVRGDRSYSFKYDITFLTKFNKAIVHCSRSLVQIVCKNIGRLTLNAVDLITVCRFVSCKIKVPYASVALATGNAKS